ncbi:MAG: hypothetical protein ACYDEK_11670 [Vulcanimicrobiaceae bacterium]
MWWRGPVAMLRALLIWLVVAAYAVVLGGILALALALLEFPWRCLRAGRRLTALASAKHALRCSKMWNSSLSDAVRPERRRPA